MSNLEHITLERFNNIREVLEDNAYYAEKEIFKKYNINYISEYNELTDEEKDNFNDEVNELAQEKNAYYYDNEILDNEYIDEDEQEEIRIMMRVKEI